MVDKYETRCWLCGSPELEPDARGFKCQSCGATYTAVLKPGPHPITMRPDPVTGQLSASPSDAYIKSLPLVRDNRLK